MSSASNKYFDAPAPAPEHPRIRAWGSYRKNPEVDHAELEIRRNREGLTFLPTRMFVTFYRADGDIFRGPDEAEWELELDDWLVKEHVRAKDKDNEKLRFSLRLKAAMRPIAARFGDGYFNSVLVYLLRKGPFANHSALAETLGSIHEYEAAGGSRLDCEELIDHELGVAAQELMGLYADRTVAEDILAQAIAQYLDDRFHVTDRRLLGLG
ncbi:MAG TPA: hypothetical protein VNO30_23710 [Kofleriaceae bacterium]|nr:hypothetical protein [Kofleriaceae bacterium]